LHRSLRTLIPLAAAVFALSTSAAAAERGERDRHDDPKARARFNAELRQDPKGRILSENRLEALKKACEMPVDRSMRPSGGGLQALAAFPGLSWQQLGPRPAIVEFPEYNFHFGAVSGRVTALAVHPTNPSFLLLGAATGGIWKSTDGGANWRPVGDQAPALAISGIAFSRSSPNVVYAATGEADSADLEFTPSDSQGTYLGAGLLRSVDAGETWTRIDADLPRNSVLSRVLVHPTNPQLVVVGVYMLQAVDANTPSGGAAYRSTDGGVHFAKTRSHAVSDLAQDPNDADVVWGGFGITGGCRRTCTDGAGVYKSTDFGKTWSASLVPGITAGADFTIPSGNIKLSVAGTPTVLYASVLDTDDAHVSGGIYRSTDAGATWTKRTTDPDMCPDPDTGSQCSYDHFIAVNPASTDTLYVGTGNLDKSTDGALTWTDLTKVYEFGGPGTIHPDQHAALFLPGELLIANDGGVYRTRDGGTSFESRNTTLTLAQFNSIALHPTDRGFVMGGTQDNGNLRFRNSLEWTDRTGGDGGFNLINPKNPSQILSGYVYAAMNYSDDGGQSFTSITPAALASDDFSPKEPMRFYPPAAFAPANPDVVFIGTERVWANATFGKDGSAWQPRNGTADVRAAIKTNFVTTALAVAGDGTGVIWAGLRCRSSATFTCPATPSATVALSTDGGATWTERPGLPGGLVTRIVLASDDGRTAYVALAGYSGTPGRHVFRTVDAGQTWTDVSGNLPDVPVSSFAVDPGDPNDLFAGTDAGVFRSTDGGASWSSFNQGLPNVSVYDLRFHPGTGDLIAATYGRGLFRVAPGATVAILPSADFSASPTEPANGRPVSFLDRSAGAPTTWAWSFGDGTSGSTDRSPTHVFNQSGTYKVTLTVQNAAGTGYKERFVTVADGAGAGAVTVQVPVVLDVYGVPPTHFTSDLVAVNRSSRESRVSVVYTTAPELPGNGGPVVQEILAPNRELRIGDVISYLRDRGYDLPFTGGLKAGTLLVTFEDVSDAAQVFVGSRTSTPNPDLARGGSFGLFFGAQPLTAASPSSALLVGLREDSSFRTNVALVDVPGGTGPAKLSIQLVNGDTGQPAGSPITYQLRSGEWAQNITLQGSGATNGWAKVTKVGGGTNRFLAYGSLVDGPRSGGGTGDGSILGADASSGLVPIVLRVVSGTALFTSELILTNPTSSAATVTLTYTPSPQLRVGTPGTATVTIPANAQLRKPDAISYLRDELHLPLSAGDVNQGGTLMVTGAIAYVRTSNPNVNREVGGSFGLAYPAVPASSRAKTEAWIYGLVQNGDTRSNLAIADARIDSTTPVTYEIEVYDASSGSGAPKQILETTLLGGEWHQFSSILFGAGVTNGYVRVKPHGTTSDYVVYGILNDGASPDQRTSDGSYVAMSGAR
jgi:PKD repeat protein